MLDTLKRLFRRRKPQGFGFVYTDTFINGDRDAAPFAINMRNVAVYEGILAVLRRDYPPAIVGETALLPNLPRGAETRIALELGCSRGYVSRVARGIGYHVEGKP